MLDLKHFVTLARRGKIAGASGGEKRAFQLALAVLNHTPGLDADATSGLVKFIAIAQADWDNARSIIGVDIE